MNAGGDGGGGGSGGSGGFLRPRPRRDDDGRNKQGGYSRRHPFTESFALRPRPLSTNYVVNKLKLQAASTNRKNLANIKLPPPQWATSLEGTSRLGSVGVTRLSFGARLLRSTPVVTTPKAPAPNAQESLPDDKFRKLKPIVDLTLINPNDEEFRQKILQFETKYHAAVIANILNIVIDKTVKDVSTLAKSIVHLVTTNTISTENFEAGLIEILGIAPDLYIDIPKFYDHIGIILSPHIEKKHITLAKTFEFCETIIAANQGHLLLKAIIYHLKESMGRSFVKMKWEESGLQLSQWMNRDQLINACGGNSRGGGGSRCIRLDDGRNKRGGDSRRHPFTESFASRPHSTNYVVDKLKLQANSNQKRLANMELAPPQWTLPKPQQPPATSNMSSTRSGSVGGTRSTSVTNSEPPAPNAPQEPLPADKFRKLKPIVDLTLLNPDDEEFRHEILQFETKYHAAVIANILNIVFEKTVKDVSTLTKSIVHLVTTNTISTENFEAGLIEILGIAPDLYIDIPKFYDLIGIILSPHIEKKHITLAKTFEFCETIIAANQGHLLLKAIIYHLKESMGRSFVKIKWQESGLQLSQWMNEDQVPKWIADNKFEFLADKGTETYYQANEETVKQMTPAETQSKLLQLMNSDESCEYIKGWVQDKLGKAHNEDWFMRTLIQAICDHALFGNEDRSVPNFNQDRMSKYAGLIHDFGVSKESREANCLFGIQHLIHRLEHPKGLTLDICQYLLEQYLISLDGFLAWEESDEEPEGKGVMLMALTSFFTNIKEAMDEDSGSD